MTDIDQAGRTHAIWPLPARRRRRTSCCALAGGGELVVADGNHRSLAAQTGGLPRFLAVVTTPASVAIQPYHRLVSELPLPLDELLDRLRAAGAHGRGDLARATGVPAAGTVHLYAAGPGLRGRRCRRRRPAPLWTHMDHALVERVAAARRAAASTRATSGSRTSAATTRPEWLVGEVDAGRAELAMLIAPVTVDDFVAVNLARQKMPRKSTWFTPKARAGLVLADLAAEG